MGRAALSAVNAGLAIANDERPMSYEACIRAELASSWIARPRKAWLEKELAKLLGGSPHQQKAPNEVSPCHIPTAAPATANRCEHLSLVGGDDFVRATKRAIAYIRPVPSWRLVLHLTSLRDAGRNFTYAGGYVSSGVFTVAKSTWSADSKNYASAMAHEGCHASRGCAYGAEEERYAFAAQIQALREMGASRSMIAEYENHLRNPIHQVGWAKEWAQMQGAH